MPFEHGFSEVRSGPRRGNLGGQQNSHDQQEKSHAQGILRSHSTVYLTRLTKLSSNNLCSLQCMHAAHL
ncbi:hypothetical protein DCAR_0104271 [Daucus carota subsp. sativus]|uniref:Uncharacterized protein n=1 Tax=Daucus carota subsp. sativus TaxID=79200 RepID=A0A162B8I2_DAUCS|nr:hypothetical protein DCAR_0104271 [Daucus carota subsp. sativus]